MFYLLEFTVDVAEYEVCEYSLAENINGKNPTSKWVCRSFPNNAPNNGCPARRITPIAPWPTKKG